MIKNINSFITKAKKNAVSSQAIVACILMAASAGAIAHDLDEKMSNGYHSPTESMEMLLSDIPYAPVYNSDSDRLKILEVGDPRLDKFDGGAKINAIGKLASFADSDKSLHGYSMLFGKEKNNLTDAICMIAHEQPHDRLHDGFYIDPNRQIPAMIPQHYADFFVKSHEAGHCSFAPLSPEGMENNAQYYTSMNEVAADLTAIIDYMRVTGEDDIYNDFIRPLRIGSLGVSSHKTAWALDVILEDVKPSIMHKKEASEIPEIVNFLMKKHMLNEAGTDIDYEKEAAKKMTLEILADSDIVNGVHQLSDQRTTDRLKNDASDTVFKQIQRYSTVVENDELINFHIENLSDVIERYDLPDPKGHWRPKMKGLDQSISKHSYVEHFMGDRH